MSKQKPMAAAAALAACFAAIWLGAIPARYLPWKPVNLAEPTAWFLDLKLSSLKNDPGRCAAILTPPNIVASEIPDNPVSEGCGWHNAVRISSVGGARLSAAASTCELAATLALWMTHDVQRAAQELLGSPVAKVESFGTYACRNIRGSSSLSGFRSQHARANAIDIAAFILKDGRRISIKSGWASKGPEAAFLKRVHKDACRRFRVALSPNYNEAHHDHLHLDRAAFQRCR